MSTRASFLSAAQTRSSLLPGGGGGEDREAAAGGVPLRLLARRCLVRSRPLSSALVGVTYTLPCLWPPKMFSENGLQGNVVKPYEPSPVPWNQVSPVS